MEARRLVCDELPVFLPKKEHGVGGGQGYFRAGCVTVCAQSLSTT